MTTGSMSHEHRQQFSEALDGLRRGTVEMGSLVLENTRRLADALLENDLELAQRVVDADVEIDERYVTLEGIAFQTMARQQPVAGDLRFLVAITRLLYEIERSGDLAVNAAKGLLRRDGYELSADIRGRLGRIATLVTEIWAKSIDVLADLDGQAAAWLDRLDDEVDGAVGEFYTVIGASSDDLGFEIAVELSRVGRYLERIADHAVNIGEHVAFVATGEFPEHSHPPREQPGG